LQELGWSDNIAVVSFDSVVVGGTDSPHASASIITHVLAACQREGVAFVHGLHEVASVVHVLDAASFIQGILRQWKQSDSVRQFHIVRPKFSAAVSSLNDHLSAALHAASLKHCTLQSLDVSDALTLNRSAYHSSSNFDFDASLTTRFEGFQAAAAAGHEWRLRREDFSNIQPYVSIVLATRVDNHEGNFIQRLQNNIDLMSHMVSLYDVSAELLLVEWNPTNATLMQSLRWPTCATAHKNSSDHWNKSRYTRGCLSIRIVQVPSDVHAAMPRSDMFKLFEFKAKNVGIVRARGRFIITGTPDSLWDPLIFSWLGREIALEDRLYRACRSSLTRPPPSITHLSFSSRVAALVSYMQSSPVDPSSLPPPAGSCPVCCEGQGGRSGPRTRLHFGCTCGFGMASGDFAMSSKSLWHRIGGYPEWPVNFHMDSLLNAKFGSVFGGILETTLEGSVYHQWHPRTSKAGWAEPIDWPVPMCDFICCEGGSNSGSNAADGRDSFCQESWGSSSYHSNESSSSGRFGCSDGPLTDDVWGLEHLQLPECELQSGTQWICSD
jgi:hypothetical protein